VGRTMGARVADQPRHPLATVFGRTRKVAEPGMRADHHQHVGEALHQDAEISLRPRLPLILQPAPIDAPDIDAVEAAGDRVEPGRVDDDVELVFGVARFDADRRDALDRRLVDVNELDVGLIVDLVARVRRISFSPILPLCNGAHQLGVCWSTVRWPAVLATSWMVCTPVAFLWNRSSSRQWSSSSLKLATRRKSSR
jgi:hypothetical protein